MDHVSKTCYRPIYLDSEAAYAASDVDGAMRSCLEGAARSSEAYGLDPRRMPADDAVSSACAGFDEG